MVQPMELYEGSRHSVDIMCRNSVLPAQLNKPRESHVISPNVKLTSIRDLTRAHWLLS